MGLFTTKNNRKKLEEDAQATPGTADIAPEARQRRNTLFRGGFRKYHKAKDRRSLPPLSPPKVTTPSTEEEATPSPKPPLLATLNVNAECHDVEVLTIESQAILSKRKEEQIRKQLFDVDSGNTAPMRRVATVCSQEVTHEGKVIDADNEITSQDGKTSRRSATVSTGRHGSASRGGRAVEDSFQTADTSTSGYDSSFDSSGSSGSSPRSQCSVQLERPLAKSKPGPEQEATNKPEVKNPVAKPVVSASKSPAATQPKYVLSPGDAVDKEESYVEEKKDSNEVDRVETSAKELLDDDGEIDENMFREGIPTADTRIAAGGFPDISMETTEAPQRDPNFSPKRLLTALQCAEDTTLKEIATKVPMRVVDLFYDTVCQPLVSYPQHPKQRQGFFDEKFTMEFLHVMTSDGITCLYLQSPGTVNNTTDEWNGRTVNIVIEPGTTGNEYDVQPKLEWTTIAGGQTFDITTSRVSLLNILSINSSAEEDEYSENEAYDVCFFTITTNVGDVHIFEANSPSDRNRIVNGLKNVIARFIFQLVAGDVTGSSELYRDDALPDGGANPAELPMLSGSHQAMNRIAHAMLD